MIFFHNPWASPARKQGDVSNTISSGETRYDRSSGEQLNGFAKKRTERRSRDYQAGTKPEMTSYWRLCYVIKSHRRQYGVILTDFMCLLGIVLYFFTSFWFHNMPVTVGARDQSYFQHSI